MNLILFWPIIEKFLWLSTNMPWNIAQSDPDTQVEVSVRMGRLEQNRSNKRQNANYLINERCIPQKWMNFAHTSVRKFHYEFALYIQ